MNPEVQTPQFTETQLANKGIRWDHVAACSPETAHLFFPESVAGNRLATHERVKQAKKLCGQCAVRDVCLQKAVENREHETIDGIRGGLTPEERRNLPVVKLQQRLRPGRV